MTECVLNDLKMAFYMTLNFPDTVWFTINRHGCNKNTRGILTTLCTLQIWQTTQKCSCSKSSGGGIHFTKLTTI